MIIKAGTELRDAEGKLLCVMARDWDDSKERRWSFDMIGGFAGDIRRAGDRLPVTSALLRLMVARDYESEWVA